MSAYLALEKLFGKLNRLEGAGSILHWDAAVMMPLGSAGTRAEQLAALETVTHEMLVSPSSQDLLNKAQEEKNLNDWQQTNLALMHRKYRHASAVSEQLIEAFVKARSESEMVWREARKDDDFNRFLPYQQNVLDIAREVAQAKAEALGLSPYDALLDGYDPGTKSTDIDALFAELKAFLPGFTQQVMERQRTVQPLQGPFPVTEQQALGRKFIVALGFDFNHGRLDISHHPFCGGVPGDVRITTRYDEGNFLSALMGCFHETGHALYESNLPQEWRGQPVGEALGMSAHESQSLLIEMQLCRSREFLEYAAPIISEHFGPVSPDYLFQLLTEVKPSLIRVNADEVTYPCHIILRYELEKELIAGRMEAKDLPEAWNAKMKELLGIEVPTDRDGCMQDIHWPDGSFGYFPTYTLGAILAAQWFDAAKRQVPGLMDSVTKGEFTPLRNWLTANIYSQGSRFPTRELIEKITGRKLDAGIYMKHLEERYL